jgi:hypothetical protein
MQLPRVLLSSIVAVIASLPLLDSSSAAACSLSPCFGQYTAPAQGATLPGNAPALVQGGAPWRIDTVTSPVLTNAAGGEVPAVVTSISDGRLVALQSTLPPGTYTLAAESTCSGTASPVFAQFQVVDPAPLPTVVGTVTVGPPTRQTIEVSNGASCYESVLADVVTLTIDYHAELVPFLPVARHVLSIDGEEWLTTPYGSTAVDIPGGVVRQITTLYRRLDMGPPYGATWASGIGPGHHQAELVVSIAGMAAPLPGVPFEFDFPAASTQGQPGTTAGGGGCTLSTGSRPASWLLLAGVAALMAVTRRRRQ